MNPFKYSSLRVQGAARTGKGLQLRFGVFQIGAIRIRKVRAQPIHMQPRLPGKVIEPYGSLCQRAGSAHARIDIQMHRDSPAAAVFIPAPGFGSKCSHNFGVSHHTGEAILCYLWGFFGRAWGKYGNLGINPIFAQLNTLPNGGNSQPTAASLQRCPGYRQKPMSIRICLHYRHHM
jgi:hypothetical protein